MTIYVALLALWIIAMLMATYLFCGAAREFLHAPEVALAPINKGRGAQLPKQEM